MANAVKPNPLRRILRSLTRLQKWSLGLAVAVVLYAVIGFLVVPPVLRWQLKKQLPPLVLRGVDVGRVQVNPFALSLRIENLALTTTNGEPFASVGEFYVNLQSSSLFRRAFVLDEVRVGSFQAHVERVGELAFNFDDILAHYANAEPSAEPAALPRAFIRRIAVTNGALHLADLTGTNAFRASVTPIECLLTNFSTVSNHFSPHEITARISNGESLRVDGAVCLQPVAARGRVTLNGLNLPAYQRYAEEFVDVVVQRGRLDFTTEYWLALEAAATNIAVTNLAVDITDVHLFEGGTNRVELAAVDRVGVSDVAASLAGKFIRVGAVRVDGARRVVQRYPATTLESTMLIKKETIRELQTVFEELNDKLGWKLSAPLVEATNVYVRFEDYTHAPPTVLEATNIAARVTGLSNERNAPVRVVSSVDALPSGAVSVEVDATLIPVKAAARVKVRDGDVRPMAPYVRDYAPLDVLSGLVSLDLETTFDPHDETTGLVEGRADTGIRDFALKRTGGETNLVQWRAVTVDGLEFSVRPEKFRIREIHLDGLRVHVARHSDEQLEVLKIVEEAAKKFPPATNAPPPDAGSSNRIGGLPPIQLAVLRLTDVGLDATDHAMEPVARAGVATVSGTIEDLSSDRTVRARVNLEGRMDEHGPFSVKGAVQPIATPWFADLAVSTRNISLMPGSPYFGRFAGYPLRGGSVATEFRWQLEDRKINLSNIVTVSGMKLGQHTRHPDAIKLPVKLGIALLTDNEGRIELDVPVKGSLDDPKFNVWNVVWQVLENLLIKAATAPFALLGSMFGGGGDELGWVEFEAGSGQLDGEDQKKLDRLARALAKRPLLTLEIGQAVEPVSDRAAMHQARFEALLASHRETPPGAAATNTARPAGAERGRLLRIAYTNAFGPFPLVTNIVLFTNAPPADGSTPPVQNPAAQSSPAASGAAAETEPEGRRFKSASAPLKGAQMLTVVGQSRGKPDAAPDSDAEASAPAPMPATGAAAGSPSATGSVTPVMAADGSVTGEVRVTEVVPSAAEMTSKLMATIEVTDADLAALAVGRAQAIRLFLLGKPDLTEERLYLKSPDPAMPSEPSRRVAMQLN